MGSGSPKKNPAGAGFMKRGDWVVWGYLASMFAVGLGLKILGMWLHSLF
jgi:hypothetical protein